MSSETRVFHNWNKLPVSSLQVVASKPTTMLVGSQRIHSISYTLPSNDASELMGANVSRGRFQDQLQTNEKKNLFKKNFYCLITVVPIFPHYSPLPYPTPPPTFNPPHCPCPWVLYTCSLMTLSLLSPITPLPHSLWSLSVCSLFPCLWGFLPICFVN